MQGCQNSGYSGLYVSAFCSLPHFAPMLDTAERQLRLTILYIKIVPATDHPHMNRNNIACLHAGGVLWNYSEHWHIWARWTDRIC